MTQNNRVVTWPTQIASFLSRSLTPLREQLPKALHSRGQLAQSMALYCREKRLFHWKTMGFRIRKSEFKPQFQESTHMI